ncbi:unnamed protein product, partial [Notodromas monacha]
NYFSADVPTLPGHATAGRGALIKSANEPLGFHFRSAHVIATKPEKLYPGQYQKAINPEQEQEELFFYRYRPERLDQLCKISNFTKKEIQLIYRGFKQECPTGIVNEELFKDIFAQFFPQGDASTYAHYVFQTFVKHQDSNYVNFEEYLKVLSLLSRGSMQDKVTWVFRLYDLNGDGRITRAEMSEVVHSIYDLLGNATVPHVSESAVRDHVDRVFDQMDKDQKGTLTKDDFLRWCTRDVSSREELSKFDTVL